MNKSILILLSILFVFLLSISLQAKTFFIKNKEVFYTKTSLLLTQDVTDSILHKEYEKAKLLYESDNHVESLRKALYLNEQIKNSKNIRLQFKITFLIADIYRKNREHKKSIPYYKKSLEQLESVLLDGLKIDFNQRKILIENFFRLGAQYQLLRKNDSAIFYYNKLLELNFLDNETLDFKAKTYSNLSGIYQYDTTMLNHYDKAIEFAEKAIAIHQNKKNRISQASAINNLANVYLLQGNFEQSKKTYFEGLMLIKRDTSN